MDVRGVDLNLLVAFAAMADHRSVTRAGQSIGLSQPAMSAALQRLRTLFDDPLFVRAGAGMAPTAKALDLAGPVRRVLDLVREEVLQRTGFDPARADRLFSLVTPDIGEIHFVPALIARLQAEAPNTRLRTVARDRSAAAEALESGAADLAVGYFPDLRRDGFFQQRLFDNRLVGIARAGHPEVGPGLGLADYLALPHAEVRPHGREHVLEQFLERRGLRRRVLVELSHFAGLLPVIEGTDLVAAVPSAFAARLCSYADIQQFELPIRTPPIPVHQSWHRRAHKDPANMWLRSLVHALFARPPGGPP